MIKKIIKKSFFRIFFKGNNIKTFKNISIFAHISNCDLEFNVMVAKKAEIANSKVGYLSSIGRYSKIVHAEIGKYCAISWDVTINAISHPHTNLSISAFPYVPSVGGFVNKRIQDYQKVLIKNDVWIGANSVIMPGVVIGNGAIIGAGAVVTKDVPDYAIVAGVPATILKYRFDRPTIDRLLKLEWWDFEPNYIKKNIAYWQRELSPDMISELENISK